MSTLITNIGELVTNAPEHAPGGASGPVGFGALSDAALVIEDGYVAWCGPAARAPAADEVINAGGRAVLPGFVDSHTHLVFAGERSAEFAARMAGQRYQAGGIFTTVAATRQASDAQLRAVVRRLAAEMLRQGTTTFECKSGYGLTAAHELRCVRLAAEVTDEVTYLGAHVVPREFADDADAYLALVCGEMLAACAPYAKWVDVFCERGAFDADQARKILAAGRAAPERRGCVGACLLRHGCHPAAWCGVLHAPALSGCPAPAQRRGHRRAGHRLQSGFVLHFLDVAGRGPRGARDADDNRGGGVGGHGGRRTGAPADRRGPLGRGRASRFAAS